MKTNNKRRLLLKLFAVILAVQMLLSFTGCELQNHLNDKIYRDAWYKIYVSTTGNDSNPGTWQKPLKTLEKARDTVRTLSAGMQGNIEVILRQGEYTLDKTFALTEADSGRNGYKIIYKSQEGEKVSISGGREVSGWTLFDSDKNIYCAQYDGVIETRQLYVNGRRAVRARSVGGLSDATYDSAGHTTSDLFLAKYKNISDLEMVYTEMWTNSRCGVDSITVDGGKAVIKMKQPGFTWCRNKMGTSVTTPWYYENAYELLDEEGEWYLDRTGAVGGKAYTFYYKPYAGEDMGKSEAVAPVLEELVTVTGDSVSKPAEHIRFEDIAFEYATWLRPSSENGHADVQNNVLREDFDPNNPNYTLSDYKYTDKMTGGNIVLKTAKNIKFFGCEFSKLGNEAVYMYNACQDNLIENCLFYDISAGAVQIGEVDMYDPDNFMPEDERLLLRNNDIINNYIHDVAVEYRSASAVGLGYVVDTDVLYNEMANLPYSGVHLGWGWARIKNLGVPCVANNRIEYNYIHDVMLTLKDGGAIYALGHHSKNGNTVIANNFIQRQKNVFAAIYLDEGCDYYSVYSNVIDTAPQWVCSKNVINDIHDNYTNQAALINDPHPGESEKAVIKNTTLVTDSNWGERAESIMRTSGVRDDYKFSIPVSGKVTFDLSETEDKGIIGVTLSELRNLDESEKVSVFIKGDGFAGKTLDIDGESLTLDAGGCGSLGGKAAAEYNGICDPAGYKIRIGGELPAGRSFITVGLADANGNVLFEGGTAVVTGYKIILNETYDDCDLGKTPENITFDSAIGSASVVSDPGNSDNRVLKIEHKSQTPSASFLAEYRLPQTSGMVSIEMDVMPTAKNAAVYAPYVRRGATEIVSASFHNNGYVAINRPPVEYYNLYRVNEWNHIRIIMDTSSQTFDLLVDGVLKKSGIEFRAGTDYIDNVCAGMYRYDKGEFYVDNILVKSVS